MIVAGAGIGGLAAALALRRRGLDVLLLEQSERFGEAGAGLQLSPNATRILHRWGLAPALAEVESTPQAAELRASGSGRLLLRTPFGEAAERRWGAPYLHVHRADLHALLVRALAEAGGATLLTGVKVAAVESPSTSVQVALEGGEHIAGEVLVGADGLRSTVRAALFGHRAARFTGQVAWRALVQAERLPSGLVPPIAAVWTGRGRHLVCYPVRGGALINLVGVVERDWRIESWTEPGDPAAFAADFAGWPEPVPTLLCAVTEAWRWALYDRPPLRRWSAQRATLLGDAAHPMPPFLAQGAAMAIEDAEALAVRLAEGGDPAAALLAYERERLPRTAKVQAWSRRNARLFHLPGPLAEAAFGAASLADRLRGSGGEARFDWLYGYDREREAAA